MDQRIIEFLHSQKALTIATSVNNVPYCAYCFYVFDEENKYLIFLSDQSTRHVTEAIENNSVAGTINTDTESVIKLKGIQFIGKFIIPTTEQQLEFYQLYYQKYPFAKAKPSKIWGIELEAIKMTDNTLGFGKKLKWNKGF